MPTPAPPFDDSPPAVWVPVHAIKGRGAASRLAHRFERQAREAFDDGWDAPGE